MNSNTISQLQTLESALTIEDMDKIYSAALFYEKKIRLDHFQSMLAEAGLSNNLNQSVIDYAFLDLKLQDILEYAAYYIAHRIALSGYINDRHNEISNRGANEFYSINGAA